ncbi:MAG: menaquinone biosynthesis protein [Prevotellaceae bacterium]|jgi:chorismate dehydratase|nr:menaquinone biosynthesis protein [Prevotellaceae bacterium]
MSVTISAVSYLNAAPLVYGIQQTLVSEEIKLSLDIPALCAQKLLTGEADIALTPVAAIPQGNDYKIITDFCIGAVGKVATVCLFANNPVESLHTIYLDAHSRTSVMLIRLLARDFWHIKPNFKQITNYAEVEYLKEGVGCVLIGDKTFGLAQKFTHIYDLAEAWISHTGLPFVFAAWVARAGVSGEIIERLNQSLQFGIQHIDKVIVEQTTKYRDVDVAHYLKHNISYPLNDSKREGLRLFLEKINKEKMG